MNEYVIATWSNGLKLVRPQDASHWSLTLHRKVLVKLHIRHYFFGKTCGKFGSIARFFSIEHEMGSQIKGAVMWALSIGDIRPGFTADWLLPRAVGDVHIDSMLADLGGEPRRWKAAADHFLRHIDLTATGPSQGRGHHGKPVGSHERCEMTWWNVINGYNVVMSMPSKEEIAGGSIPSWEVIEGWHRVAIDDAGPIVKASSRLSPYDALFKAGLIIRKSEQTAWLEKNGSPGSLNPDLSAYLLLGLPLPATYSAAAFTEWVAELGSA